MASRIYKANFHFVGNSPNNPDVRQEIIDEFVKIRSVLVDQTNPRLEEWNALYTEDMNPNEYGEDPKYNEYINSKFKPWLDLINYMIPTKYIYLDVDEHVDIIGKGIYEDFVLYLTLEPFNLT